ncbi:hypothetical protein ThvES_00007950 [Thiovulum sp. ES]|nr:hypothetical protein ThvES_00007950 [Thiovulum sp. ES]
MVETLNDTETEFLNSGDYTPETKESIDDLLNETLSGADTFEFSKLKRARDTEVSNILVTLPDTSINLNGDEVSQERISRAVIGLSELTSETKWIDSEGNLQTVTKGQLLEVLKEAGQKQTEIFMEYAKKKQILLSNADT